jgi:hypothetical protein
MTQLHFQRNLRPTSDEPYLGRLVCLRRSQKTTARLGLWSQKTLRGDSIGLIEQDPRSRATGNQY